jgi:hypothetical protein
MSSGRRAEAVAQLAVQRHDHGRRDEVRGDDRRHLPEVTEIAGDGRQRRSHDRLVERAEQHHEHQPGEDLPDHRSDRACARLWCRRMLRHGRSPKLSAQRTFRSLWGTVRGRL